MSVTFAIPAGVRYECSRCGDCCRSFNVLVTDAEARAVAALDWAGARPDLDEVPKVRKSVDPALKGRMQLARHTDGRCVFLDGDGLCAIHKRFGADAKPLICRLYPFGFYPMGSRVGVDVAFTCNAVHRDHGPEVSAQETEWVRLLFRGEQPKDASKHQLESGKQIPGDIAWEFEHRLVSFLLDDSMPFRDRVRACVQFLRLATTGDPLARTAGVFRDAIARGIPAQLAKLPPIDPLDATQRAAFRTWLFLALNPRPLGWESMGTVERQLASAARLQAGERFCANTGRPWIDNEPIRAEHAAIDATAMGWFASEGDDLLARYFAAKIVGQKFLVAEPRELPLVPAARRLFVWWPMILWTGKALAADRGAPAVEEPDARRAVRLLDRSLGVLHPDELPPKQREAMTYILEKSDLSLAAAQQLLDGICDSAEPSPPAPSN